MKKHIFLTLLFGLLCGLSANAQKTDQQTIDNYLKAQLNSDYQVIPVKTVDTVPDYGIRTNKIKVTGTIYKSDGVSPASNVILFIEQADEDGDFDVSENNGIREIRHRAWIKTDSNGQYTFYTFIPGNDRRYNQLQQLFPIIKEPSKPAYELTSFLFDGDPLLSRRCRKRMAKKGDTTIILEPQMVDGMLVAKKDIILSDNLALK